MHEMTIAISSICKLFDLELAVEPNAVIEEFSFSMHPKNLRIRLVECKAE